MNIKLVHLLLDPNFFADIPEEKWKSVIDKQQQSIDSFSKVKSHFVSYTQQFSKVNRTELPIDTCAVPELLKHSLNEDINDVAISYGHYGAFKAHSRALKHEFSEDIDAIIVIEGDVILTVSPDEFISNVKESLLYGQRNDASFITFGELKLGVRGNDNVWEDVEYLEKYNKVPHFLCCHCYMVFPKERENIKYRLETTKWHAFDIWLFWRYDRRVRMYSTKDKLVTEAEGYSVIDLTSKKDGKYLI